MKDLQTVPDCSASIDAADDLHGSAREGVCFPRANSSRRSQENNKPTGVCVRCTCVHTPFAFPGGLGLEMENSHVLCW